MIVAVVRGEFDRILGAQEHLDEIEKVDDSCGLIVGTVNVAIVGIL